jgi:alginate O-acetyltransferase complex protein AlgI
LLHGGYLVVNNVWSRTGRVLPSPFAWAGTFLAVVVGWVLFRATTFSGAMTILRAMFLPAGTVADPQMVAAPALAWLAIAAVAAISFLLPNSMELVGYAHVMPNDPSDQVPLKPVTWRPPAAVIAVTLGAIAALVIAKLPDPGVFLYFNF